MAREIANAITQQQFSKLFRKPQLLVLNIFCSVFNPNVLLIAQKTSK
jgi:hypothetical protein